MAAWAMYVAVAAIGAVVTLVVGFLFRSVLTPWVVRPIVAHLRAELTDVVTVIVLSPEVQADLRDTIEEVVAAEAAVIVRTLHELGIRVGRLESGQGDLTRMVRSQLPPRDPGGRRGTPL